MTKPDFQANPSGKHAPETAAPGNGWLELEDRYQIPSYAKWPVTFVRGFGCRVWDDQDRDYLDFYGGHCVALIGHCHPHWAQALARQAARLGFYSNVAGNDVRAEYQQRLIGFCNNHLKRVFLCNSGTEANETALKLALKATGRTRILCLEGGFHGRTAGALSVTSLGAYRDQFPSLVRPAATAPFGDAPALGSALSPETAAVILEPVQSMNGVNSAPASYYREVVDLCHENGTLVIFDEVQTALGRLGAPLAAHLFGAKADIITAAKGIGNGFPMGVVLAREEVAREIKPGELGTTFGGGPLACAAGLAVLEVVRHERLVEHAARMERVARRHLLAGPVRAIRGHGMLLGLETEAPAREVVAYLRRRRILTGTSAHPHVLRLMPPLVVQEADIRVLANALSQFHDEPGAA